MIAEDVKNDVVIWRRNHANSNTAWW